MAQDEQARSVQPDRPAKPDVETREETVERVVREADEHQAVPAREELADPTTRRGVNRTLARNALIAAGIGAVAGAVLGIVLSLLPGPVETDSAAGAAGYAVVMAVLVAIVVGLIATLILLAREDGRVEREVERATGRAPEAPGSPSDPKYDVPGR